MLGLRRGLLLPKRSPACKLRLVHALKFLAALGYFLVTLTLSLYLTDELGFSDTAAGSMYGILGMLISLFTLPAGMIIDRIGIKRSLLLGAVLSTTSRLVLAVVTSPWLCVGVLLTSLPMGEAFAVPSLSAAVGQLGQRAAAAAFAAAAPGSDADRKGSTAAAEAAAVRAAYGLFYTMMNVGLLCCGPIVDWLRFTLPHPYRYACLLSACCSALTLVLARWLDLSSTADENSTAAAVAVAASTTSQATVTTVGVATGQQQGTLERMPLLKDEEVHFCEQEAAYLKQRRRRGFLILVSLLVGVRALFRHLDATFPKCASAILPLLCFCAVLFARPEIQSDAFGGVGGLLA